MPVTWTLKDFASRIDIGPFSSVPHKFPRDMSRRLYSIELGGHTYTLTPFKDQYGAYQGLRISRARHSLDEVSKTDVDHANDFARAVRGVSIEVGTHDAGSFAALNMSDTQWVNGYFLRKHGYTLGAFTYIRADSSINYDEVLAGKYNAIQINQTMRSPGSIILWKLYKLAAAESAMRLPEWVTPQARPGIILLRRLPGRLSFRNLIEVKESVEGILSHKKVKLDLNPFMKEVRP